MDLSLGPSFLKIGGSEWGGSSIFYTADHRMVGQNGKMAD
jgi:cephalosporin hydroxylase